jgi:glycosyltransferase involved in cell wall biosynthesis
MKHNRVLIPIIQFSPSGGNRVLCCLATEYVRMGIAVDFLILDSSSKPPFPTQARLIYAESIDSAFDTVETSKKIEIVHNIIKLARAIKLSKNDYDFIIASYSLVALACALAGYAKRTLYYVQSYDPEIFVTKRKFGSFIASIISYFSFLLCRNQIVNSPHYIGYSGITAKEFVPPGVDTTIFHPRRSPPKLYSKPLKIGIIGRSEPHKFRPVIEAFLAIQRIHPLCHLVVAYGNIPAEELASVGPHTIVVPRNDEELAAFYRSCDVFLALSEFGAGAFYPPLEALASGTFLISNRFLYVNENNSWIVDEPEQAAAAFEMLLSCSAEEREAKRLKGINDVAQMLQWPTVARKLLTMAQNSIKIIRNSNDVGK